MKIISQVFVVILLNVTSYSLCAMDDFLQKSIDKMSKIQFASYDAIFSIKPCLSNDTIIIERAVVWQRNRRSTLGVDFEIRTTSQPSMTYKNGAVYEYDSAAKGYLYHGTKAEVANILGAKLDVFMIRLFLGSIVDMKRMITHFKEVKCIMDTVVAGELCNCFIWKRIFDNEGSDETITIIIGKHDLILRQYSSLTKVPEFGGGYQFLEGSFSGIRFSNSLITNAIRKVKPIVKITPPSSQLSEIATLEIGSLAPPIAINLLNGKIFNSSDYLGKVLFIYLWRIGCGPCEQVKPFIKQLSEEYPRPDFYLIGLNDTDSDSVIVDRYVRRNHIKFDVGLVSSSQIERYGARGRPAFVIIDKLGRIAWLQLGYGKGLENEFKRILNSLFSEK